MSILTVRNLSVSYRIENTEYLAVNDLSISLNEGECLCLIGESGSGKSTVAKAIIKLLDSNATVKNGQILLGKTNILECSYKQMRSVWSKEIAIIMQDPMNSLDPSYTIYEQISEVLREHNGRDKNEVSKVEKLLRKVGIPDHEKIVNRYPFELSGGLQQRVIIAMACALRPKLIIADEPTSSLDVKTQAEILILLKSMARECGSAIFLITHDLNVVAEMADRVMVLYGGELVEERGVIPFFKSPLHPYTKAMLNSRPHLFDKVKQRFQVVPLPQMVDRKSGESCLFAERCLQRMERCLCEKPQLEGITDGFIRCFLSRG